ncbi:hypothetical protein HOLleu_36963 [Holothuria leucospilota]|uniref:B box-type domain-containing protein n=1 Tax=Holothuria leucospilota TaxID=206669 RepID=A0A9Q1BG12_HOLLE|nr:hypothetical protein HOLleu_36963 [Holothuria leucospilota]
MVFPTVTENTSNEPRMDICQTHRATREAVCLTCFEQICFACAFNLHSGHRIIALNELDDEIQKVVHDLQIEIASSENELEILHAHMKAQEYTRYEISEDELQSVMKSAGEQFKFQMHHFKDTCHATVLSDNFEAKRYKKVYDEVETSVHYYSEAVHTVLHESRVAHLQYLNEVTNKIDTEETKLNECKKYFLSSSCKNQVRPASLSAKVIVLAKGVVLGAIKVNHNQAIMIRNYQDSKNYIHLVCMSCEEPKSLLWERTFEIDQDSPLMANSLMIRPQGVMILVAFGRKVLSIEIHLNVEMHCAFFRSSNVFELNIPHNAHITGIAAVLGEVGHKEIITTDNASGMFHIFDIHFQLSERVKCSANSQVLACIQKDEVYKVAVSVNSLSASILRGKAKSKDLRCVGKIENTYYARKMFLKSIVFDGTFFSALWVSKIEFVGDIMQWRVVAYDSDGAQFQVSAEGECEPEVEPVSISHIKTKTLLCFSNGSIRAFSTGGLDDFEFPDTGELTRALEDPGAVLRGLADMLKAALE